MLNKKLVDLLIQKKYKISFAESCTGGLCASSIIEISSASSVIDTSVITYSNDSKIEKLKVSEKTLSNVGAVSEECSYEMAKGLKEFSRADINVSVTGIAGPTGGTSTKPVGLVYFCIYVNGSTYFTFNYVFKDLSRNDVRAESVNFIFKKLVELLEEDKL